MAKRTDTTAGRDTTPREVVPEFFSSDTGEGVATIDAAPPFIFAHHRKRWAIIDGRVVPDLMKIPLVSGVNRVEVAKDGRIRFANSQALLQDKHLKLIPYVLAPNSRTYLQEVPTLEKGKIVPTVISMWETAHAGESRTEWDLPAYADWLESLVARGTIAPITHHRAGEMLAGARQLLSQAEVKLGQNKAASSGRVEQLREVVAAWERVVESATAKAAKGPKVKAKSAEFDLDVREAP